MSRMKHTLVTVSIAIFITNISIASDWRENAQAIDVSGGEDHTLVLTKDKTVWACGANGGYAFEQYFYGVLGTGNNDDELEQNTLVRVWDGDMNTPSGFLEYINDIDAGWMHSLALDVNGLVWSWGDNYYGQLGDNQTEWPCSTTPVQVFCGEQPDDPCEPDGYLKYIIDISAGRSGRHSLAVDANNYAYGWGYNKYGQCGNGVHDSNELTPVRVHRGQQPFDPCDPNDWLKHIIDICAAADYSIALEKDDPYDLNFNGCVYTWGTNWWGDEYYEWIEKGYGLLGTGSDVNFSDTPVCVLRGEQDYNEPNHVYLKHIVAVIAGWDHCLALEKDDPFDPNIFNPTYKGRVYTWGNNGEGWGGGDPNYAEPWEESVGGRLGDGTYNDSNTPVLVLSGQQDPNNNEPNSYLEHIVAISAGEGHSMALDANDYVYTWGDNQYGQLGNNSNDPCSTPVRVVGRDGVGYLENIVAISAGHWHSIAIDADGTVWIWGKAKEGRLGKANNTNDSSIPHPIGVVYNETQHTFQFAIQNAINEADNNDVLEASESRYWENVNILDKSITLRSTDPDNWNTVNNTIIDGSYNTEGDEDPCFYTVNFNDGSGSTLAGFTISDANRGGVCCENLSSVDITDCKIQNNNSDGIYLNNSSVDIKNCVIQNNGYQGVAGYEYYGIYCQTNSDINITDCNISDNNDGGIWCDDSNLTVSDCIIQDNGGDGIWCDDSNLTVSDCIIEDNDGNGIYDSNVPSTVITNSIIRGNNSDGIYCKKIGEGIEIHITNNWIHNNDNGIYIYNDTTYAPLPAIVRNNTIVNNAGYGINSLWAVDANVTSCIIWANGDDLYNCSATYSCISDCNDANGIGNICGDANDPLFFDDPNDPNNYHLSFDSPCIDTGDPNFWPDPNETDIDGEDRLVNGRVDMGADEFYICPGNFNEDEIINFIDYAMLAHHWLETKDSNGYNDIYDLADNNSIDFNDVALFCDCWLWQGAWTLPPLPMMGRGMGRGMGQGLGLAESSYPSTLAEQPAKIEPLTFEQIMQLIIWLEEVWLDPDVRKAIDEDTWLKFVESIKNEM